MYFFCFSPLERHPSKAMQPSKISGQGRERERKNEDNKKTFEIITFSIKTRRRAGVKKGEEKTLNSHLCPLIWSK
jgi:hypothetical protein